MLVRVLKIRTLLLTWKSNYCQNENAFIYKQMLRECSFPGLCSIKVFFPKLVAMSKLNLPTNVYCGFIQNWYQCFLIGEQISKQVHPYSGILFSNKNKWAIASWKTWECVLLSEKIQSGNTGYYIISTL